MGQIKYKKIKKYVTDSREPFFTIASDYVKEDSVILDVGAGDGSFAKAIGRDDVYMLDGNPESVEALKKNFKNVSYGKLPLLPYDSERFDLIHTSHLVEHLMPQELYDFLKEMDRCLKPSGHLVISAPLLWREFFDDMSHIKPYNPKLFEKYLCWGLDYCCTRPLISKRYETVLKVYRYSVLSPEEDMEFFVRSHLLDKLFFAWKKLKFNLGFRKLEKSGYTIVLHKKV